MKPMDFSNRQSFPGTDESSLWFMLLLSDRLERVPALPFAVLLFALAALPTRLHWQLTTALWLFFIFDWILIAALPLAKRSFGPAKPPVLLLAILRLPAAFLPLPWSIAGQLIGSALVLYAFWIEPQSVRLSRQELHSEKLHPGFSMRMVHLSDLHMERATARERKILEWIQSLEPDLILFSGDFLNLSNVHDPQAWDEARRFLDQLTAPMGVYAVTGSPPLDKPEIVGQILEGLDIHWLQDERVTLEQGAGQFDLVGISCTHKPFLDGPRLRTAVGESNGNFSILLYHSPDLAPEAAEVGIDLQLSGHTHGGQVRLPWVGALITSSLYGKRFEVGRYHLRGLTLYVTRGIGMEGKGAPRVRFLCPPEITCWDISSTASSRPAEQP